MLFKIENPDFSKVDLDSFFEKRKSGNAYQIIEKAFQPKYLYWDDFKHKAKKNDLFLSEELWKVAKIRRDVSSIDSLLKSENGNFFRWMKLGSMDSFFHEIDLNMGGNLFAESGFSNPEYKRALMVRGLMEESIASSQLEGANTTRRAAKKMLLEKRKPRNKAEKMILNNYQVMQLIEQEYKDRDLSVDLIFELHSLLTKDTLPGEEQGRFRKDEEDIVVSNAVGDIVYHIPPKINFVKSEIKRLIDFANAPSDINSEFVHPIIKAIMLHFWIGYLHPFTDGNGRLARTLFYWYLLKNDYWAFAYLPISTVLTKAPSQYTMAYVYSEQDDYDLTYFLDFNIRKIKQSVNDFSKYLKTKEDENKKLSNFLRGDARLNYRQSEILKTFMKDSNYRINATTYSSINNISRLTAYSDLKRLVTWGFLVIKKEGLNVYYYSAEKFKNISIKAK